MPQYASSSAATPVFISASLFIVSGVLMLALPVSSHFTFLNTADNNRSTPPESMLFKAEAKKCKTQKLKCRVPFFSFSTSLAPFCTPSLHAQESIFQCINIITKRCINPSPSAFFEADGLFLTLLSRAIAACEFVVCRCCPLLTALWRQSSLAM